jgi:plastocyanin
VRRRWPGIVALAVAAGGGVGCTRPAPRTHVVEISGFGFRPETLTVAAGDTVRWVNHDAVPHSATAGPDSARTLDSGSIAPDGTWQLVARDGRYEYYSVLHPIMRGVLVVR